MSSSLRNLKSLEFHPTSEQLVKVMCDETQNTNPSFFRILVAYYFGKVASMMRTFVEVPGGTTLPVSVYAMNLATSGYGKGKSMGIVEDRVINLFRENFIERTFPAIAEMNLNKLAIKRAIRNGTDEDEEMQKVIREFEDSGPMLFGFDSGTSPALKQFRHKLLMANGGSLNFEVDEIGSNLQGNMDLFTSFLELFDKGKIKQKLVKHTNENKRSEEIQDLTPANLLAFGTPSQLLNGGKVEDDFYALLETGYARRFLYSFSRHNSKNLDISGADLIDLMENKTNSQFLNNLSNKLGTLADPVNFHQVISMDRDVAIQWAEYKIHCEKQAEKLGEHSTIPKAELSHRYFNAIRLAGIYAFIDGTPQITEDQLYNAIAMTEASGEAFGNLLCRDRPYVKLAKYLAYVGSEVTHADLVEDLPFYKGPQNHKAEMLTLATAWGYKNNVIIKKAYLDGIEFLSGESLKKTNLDSVRVSYSTDLAYNYQNECVSFDQLATLTQAKGYHWCAHHVIDGHRSNATIIEGFNLVVLDVDGGVSIDTVKLLLKEYKYHIYTTKSHTPADNRFRIVIPMNYELKMDAQDYKEFMHNIFEWLPFPVDTSTTDRCRKWLSNVGHHESNDGELLDALPFIPKTSKNEEHKKQLLDQRNLTNLERWFVNNTATGNRSNQLIKYALLLVDGGLTYEQVQNGVIALNDKLADKMDEREIMNTIMVSATKAISKRDTKAA